MDAANAFALLETYAVFGAIALISIPFLLFAVRSQLRGVREELKRIADARTSDHPLI